MLADPWSTASVPLFSPLQFAPSAQPDAEEATTGGGRSLGGQARNARRRAQVAVGRGVQGAQEFLTKYPQAGGYARGGLAIAGALPAVGESLEELQEGRPLGAGLIGKGVPGTVAGLGLMGLGAILPGAAAQGAEATRQAVTGKPTKGKEAEFSTQLAMRGQIMNQNLDGLDRSLATNLQTTKDLTTFYNQAQVDQMRAMAPEIEKAKMNDFARYQTAMALQGQIQGQLGTLATAGALAQGAQAGNYGLTATALTNNPYAGATLQAPQIRFG